MPNESLIIVIDKLEQTVFRRMGSFPNSFRKTHLKRLRKVLQRVKDDYIRITRRSENLLSGDESEESFVEDHSRGRRQTSHHSNLLIQTDVSANLRSSIGNEEPSQLFDNSRISELDTGFRLDGSIQIDVDDDPPPVEHFATHQGNTNLDPNSYECEDPMCTRKKSLNSKEKLQNHQKNCHPKKCIICNAGFRLMSRLAEHLKIRHYPECEHAIINGQCICQIENCGKDLKTIRVTKIMRTSDGFRRVSILQTNVIEDISLL